MYSERWAKLKICFWVPFTGLAVAPPAEEAGAGRGPRPWWARVHILPQVCLAAGFACLLLTCDSSAALICSFSFPVFCCATFFFFLFLPPFLFMQISFFASLLPRPLHRAGCPTSLSSAVCLFSSWPWFFLFTSCLRARYTLCFLLYRSSSFQCKINTM